MIDRAALVADLRQEVTALEDDMRAHADDLPELMTRLRLEHVRAVDAERTAMSFSDWREGELTQAAVAWVLGCVFIRFLEDNRLIDAPLLSGPGERLEAASGRRQVYFEQHPHESDREYLLWAFDDVAQYPTVAPLYDPRHNPLRTIVPSVDGARQLRELWQRQQPETGELVHDFSDPARSTRFLGDLYQDLSESAKKRYALLQTPEFVEEFILDRTLEPALDEFGLAGLRLIDPTCGSGHFLIGAFHRLLARWREREPLTNVTVLAQNALDQVYGVDLNPYATAIAEFRLLIGAMAACNITRLTECPAFHVNLATGDSLLHGPEPGQLAGFGHYRTGIAHVYDTEDAPELARIFGQGYHVVVGNPPYINVADAALRDAYRQRYRYCHGKYALTVPFMERFFELAHPQVGEQELAGYVGQITANSFMKREFGVPLVEQFLPTLDLTTLIDTSGAHIPGHGTPTVILLGRSRPPVSSVLRVLDAVRGEPNTPADPAHGLVWESILQLVDQPGEQNRFIRSSDVDRAEFATHPMTLGIGRDLRRRLERAGQRLDGLTEARGVVAVTLEDDVFALGDVRSTARFGVDSACVLVDGAHVRDFAIRPIVAAVFPYAHDLPAVSPRARRRLWPWRDILRRNVFFGRDKAARGLEWFEYGFISFVLANAPRLITWGEVATHNHFALDRGGKVFKQTAPVIKLPANASEEDHLRLLGVLNSSAVCFWLKQVCTEKPGFDEPWTARVAINTSNVADIPCPSSRPLHIPERLDELAGERSQLFDSLVGAVDLRTAANDLRARDADLFAEMISLQEELDWEMLASYGVATDDLSRPGSGAPSLNLGERAFEVVLARKVARGEVETAWFESHGSTPITEPAAHWPAAYRKVVEQRIALIESDPDVGLIERPEHKRRWNGTPPFEQRLREALESMVLDRLEADDLWAPEPRLRSLAKLTDVIRRDARLVAACELIGGNPDADVGTIVAELVLGEAVPFLAAHRHTESGMRKRATWEEVWDLQRREDAIDALTELPEEDPDHLNAELAERRKRDEVGRIPVPPRYAQTDFRSGPGWRLRGKLDVPKERFTLVQGAERGAGGPVLGWAGWDELDRARSLATRIIELQSQDAADAERLRPLLAGVLELLPWIHQWHPESDPLYSGRPGAFFESWLDGMLSQLGLTRDELRAFRPPAPARGRRGR
jgi:hypothetical protein